MGGYVYRAKRAACGGARRHQLLASAAMIVAAVAAVEVAAEEQDGWLLWDLDIQAGSGPIQESTRPSWDGEYLTIINDELASAPGSGLVGRSKAGLISWRGQFIRQANSERNDAAQGVMGGDWQRAGTLTLRNNGLILTEAAGIAGSGKALSHTFTLQALAQGNAAVQGKDGEEEASDQDLVIDQQNKATQEILGEKWSLTGSVEVENNGSVEAGANGIAAKAQSLLKTQSFQLMAQGNATEQYGPGSDALQDQDTASAQRSAQAPSQTNEATQLVWFEPREAVGALKVDNVGTIGAAKDGVNGRSTVVRVDQVHQRLRQGNAAEQDSTGSDSPGEGELRQSNTASQFIVSNPGQDAGRMEVENSGEIDAGRNGVDARSLAEYSADGTSDLAQGNAALQSSASGEVPNSVTLRQANKVHHNGISSGWEGAGQVDVSNRGRILADGRAIVAVNALSVDKAIGQTVRQGNVARQQPWRDMEIESIGLIPQDLTQDNDVRQYSDGMVGRPFGSLEVDNEGELRAGLEGVEARSDIHLATGSNQGARQGNRATQVAPASPSDQDAAEGGQLLRQSNGIQQRFYGSDWSGVGRIEIDNSGWITAGRSGAVAESFFTLIEKTAQTADQRNIARQKGRTLALDQTADGDSLLPQRADQENDARQIAGGSSGFNLSGRLIDNSGEIRAKEYGIGVDNYVKLSTHVDQHLKQRNKAHQPAPLVEVAPVLADAGAERGRSLTQINKGDQRAHGGDWTGAGRVEVNTSGRIRAGEDGVSVGNVVETRDSAQQHLTQHNRIHRQVGQDASLREGSWPPAAQTNEAEQLVTGSTARHAGSIMVENSGEIRSGWDGIYSYSIVDQLADTTQILKQRNRAPGDALTHVSQTNQASQKHLEGDNSFLGAIEIANQGDIRADWFGISAWNYLDGGSSVLQEYVADSSARAVIDQQVEGADWTGTGSVSIRNSGSIRAQEVGIDPGSLVMVGMNIRQSVESAAIASQTVKLAVGEAAAAVDVHNSGDVASGWAGIHAGSALSVDVGVVQSVASTASGSQLVDLSLGAKAGTVDIVNSGEVTAGTDGLVADANVRVLLNAEQLGEGVERAAQVDIGPDVAAVHIYNSHDGRVFAEEGWGIIAHSNLYLDLSGAVEAETAAGPRIDIVNDGLIFARSGISASSVSGDWWEDLEAQPAGDIEIEIGENGVVLALEGPAVEFLDGEDNKLLNKGLLISHGDLTVSGGDQNERVVNHGMLVGGLDLGGGENAILNEANGIFAPGSLVRLGEGTVRNRGLLAPGFEEIQHTTIEGDLHLEDGSLYLVDINSAGESDHIRVEGKAVVEQEAVLAVERAPDDYPLNQQYSIFSSSEEIDGTFGSVDLDLPFLALRVTPEEDRKQLTLHVGRSDTSFDKAARSRNQRAVARALESLGPGQEDSLYRQLVWMTEEEAREAYDTLSGEVHATANAMPLDIGRRLRSQISKRMSGFSGSSGGSELQANSLAALAVSDADPVAAPTAADGGNGPAAWIELYAGTGTLEGDGNAADTRTDSWGGLIGAEMLFSETFGMGMALGYQSDKAKIDDRASRVEADTYSLSTYGLWRSGGWRLRGGASFGWHDLESERTVRLPSGNRQATADYDGWSAQVFAEVGHRFQLESLALEPFAGMSFQHSRTESYRESGAGDANLEVAKDRSSTVHTTLGVQVSETFELESDLRLKPFATLGWEHRVTGSSSDADLAFAAGGERFTVSGAKRSKDAALLGVGLDIGVGGGVEAFGAYDAYISNRQHDHTARAGLRIRF